MVIKIDNPEKLATQDTQDEDNPHKKHNTNKSWALPQTTGGKDDSNIVFMRKSLRTSQHGTQNVKTHNRTK